MAEREFIDGDKLSEQIKFEHNYLRAVFYEDKDISLADVDRAMNGIESTKKNKITEEEIIKPYLEKLKAKFEEYRDKWNRYGNEYESGKYDSYDICIDDIEDMINLLTEKGAEK